MKFRFVSTLNAQRFALWLLVACFVVFFSYVAVCSYNLFSFSVLKTHISSWSRTDFNATSVDLMIDTQILKEQKNVTLVQNTTTKGNSHSVEEKTFHHIETSDNHLKLRKETTCKFSNGRTEVCELNGDIRIIGKNLSTVFVVSPFHDDEHNNNSWQVTPYPRKWDGKLMSRIQHVIIQSATNIGAPQCTVNHAVPAIIFSIGGYTGNFYHDFMEVLIPLFQTSRQFDGNVQFLVSSMRSNWIHKYMPLLQRLTFFDIIDYDNDDRVHCFENVIVGLMSDDKEFMINPLKTPGGYSMLDFMKFMRKTYALNRNEALNIVEQVKKPRLLIILRRRTRRFVNANEIVSMAKELGFEVVATEADTNIANFSRIVNSCDVLMGVHGAGLSNFVFLPTNAVFIQVVPIGKLDWLANTCFKEPAKFMKLKYLEYEISAEESTLIDKYSSDNVVFTDPQSLGHKSWSAWAKVFLMEQNVRLDVKKFQPVLEQALEHLYDIAN